MSPTILAHLYLTVLRTVCFLPLFWGLAAPAHAQYTDRAAIDHLGGPEAFAKRRSALAKELKTGIVVLFARSEIPEDSHYREDNDFYYFTGIQDPGAIVTINMENGHTSLYEPVMIDWLARIEGKNLFGLTSEERKALGFPEVLPVTVFDSYLGVALQSKPGSALWLRLGYPDQVTLDRVEGSLYSGFRYSHPYRGDLPPEMAQVARLRERYPMAQVKDVTPAIDRMRNIKSPEEIAVLRRNGKISAEGDREAIAHAHPGMYQYEIEGRAFAYFYSHGAQGVAYPAIVGSGENINTWHYFSNRNMIQANELVVFDYAASLDHLTMDITRTFNISGKFTPEQAKWYSVDLEAQKAVIALLRPGQTYEDAVNAGKAVYEKAGIGDQWHGFPGHFVGMATHDVLSFSVSGPIQVGQVVTVEPIVEFVDKRMHFRVEDTILITEAGPEILSAAVPKELSDVEKLVGSAKEQ
jgi:Xaa-Pro aminopeptidase